MITSTEATANKQIIDANGDKAIAVKRIQAETVNLVNRAQAEANTMIIGTGQ